MIPKSMSKRMFCPRVWPSIKHKRPYRNQISADLSLVKDKNNKTCEEAQSSKTLEKNPSQISIKIRPLNFSRQSEAPNSPDEPLLPSEVLLNYSSSLTDYEKQEIWSYPEIYFFGKTCKNPSEDFTDHTGYYKALISDHIAFRYEIVSFLGKGTFSEVFNCLDHKSGKHYAIKILKNTSLYHASGEEECRILTLIKASKCPEKGINCIIDNFKFRGHICIVLEKLKESLCDLQSKFSANKLPLELVAKLTKQILRSLCFIHRLGFIHCDLKPDNLMLRDTEIPEIEIIDFNSACENTRKTADYVQSRPYRSPEIVIDIEYSNKIDIWSLGCIVIEMITGERVFNCEDEHELFKRYIEVCGYPRKEFIAKGRRSGLFVDRIGKFKIRAVAKVCCVEKILQGCGEKVVDFVERIMKWDPQERMTAEEAMQHEWVRDI